jgi:RNA polymerase-binding transcription factor DksA
LPKTVDRRGEAAKFDFFPTLPIMLILQLDAHLVKAAHAGLFASREEMCLPTPHRKLNAKDRKEFRALLLKRRAIIAGDVEHMHNDVMKHSGAAASGDLSTVPYHMADVGTDNFGHEFLLGLIENEEEELRQIDDALERLEDETYGVCTCGKQIPKPRLRALPYASLCISCKRDEENGGPQ